MKHLRFIVAVLLMLLVVILVVQNHQALSTEVAFRVNLITLDWTSRNISLYTVVTVVFLFGILISGLYGVIERFRLKREIKNMRRELADKDKELNSLRNLPITSEDVVSEQSTEP